MTTPNSNQSPLTPGNPGTPSVAAIAGASLHRDKEERAAKEIESGAGCDRCGVEDRMPNSKFCHYCAGEEVGESAQHVVQILLDAEQLEFPLDLDPNDIGVAEIVHGTIQRSRAEYGKVVDDYSVTDYGIMDSSYFQGAGTAFTEWDVVYVGTGETGYEALEQAKDDAASDGWDVRQLVNRFPEQTEDTVTNAVRSANPDIYSDDDDVDTGDSYYYVALYIKGEKEEGKEEEE